MMTAVYYSLSRHIKLGANCLKCISTLTNQTWCFAPIYWRATFQNPPPGAIPYSRLRDFKLLERSTLVDESITQYLKKDVIPWEEITTTILSSDKFGVKETELNTCVFQYCINLNLLDAGISYYKYVLSKGGKFSMLEYSHLIKLLAVNDKEIRGKYEDVVRELYQIFSPHLKSFTMINNDIFKVFCCVKDVWGELFNSFEDDSATQEPFYAFKYLVCAAFDFDEPQLGWKALHKYPWSYNSDFLKSYLEYCIRLAKSDKFSVSLINDLVDFCQKHVTTLPYSELYDSLKTLISILNNSPNKKYHWIVEKSQVNHKNYCSVCNLKLNSVGISKADYNQLKTYILNDVIISENCYLKSSQREIQNFLAFLKNSPDYNLVVDGLNVFLGKKRNVEFIEELFEYLRSKGKNCLFIAKKHFKRHPLYYIVKKHCMMFLTDDLSDDDVFLIYATLYGGMDTEFLTGDFYRGYGKFIKNDMYKRIFVKWLLSHQNLIRYNLKDLSHPPCHAFLPQSTSVPSSLGEKKHLSWHLFSDKYIIPKIKASDQFYWVCLKAVPI